MSWKTVRHALAIIGMLGWFLLCALWPYYMIYTGG